MKEYTFTKEQINNVIDEVFRRVKIEVHEACAEGQTVTLGDIKDLKATMLQGVYSALMILSANWTEVVYMIDEVLEEKAGWEEEL